MNRVGEHVLGPGDGSVMIRVGWLGAPAKRLHDLVLEVTNWGSAVEISDSSWITLAVDPGSIKARIGPRGPRKALGAGDERKIEQAIGSMVGRAPITFTSSAVQVEGDQVAVMGTLCIADRSNTIPVQLTITDAGEVRSSITIRLRSFDIAPSYTGLWGQLAVSDEVRIDIHANLPIATIDRARD